MSHYTPRDHGTAVSLDEAREIAHRAFHNNDEVCFFTGDERDSIDVRNFREFEKAFTEASELSDDGFTTMEVWTDPVHSGKYETYIIPAKEV